MKTAIIQNTLTCDGLFTGRAWGMNYELMERLFITGYLEVCQKWAFGQVKLG